MRVCVIFYNLGGYHLARLNAAAKSCLQQQWDFSAIEITRSTSEHPWGTIELPDYVTTLMEFQAGNAPSLPDADKLVCALDRIAPDVVVIPGWGYDFSRIALQWSRRNKKKSVLMCESKHDDAPRKWYTELAKKWIYVRRFDAAIVGGSKHRDYLIQLGMSPASIFNGYDVVDNDYFITNSDKIRAGAEGTPGLEAAPSKPFFLSSNRFIERKNLRFLIEAFGTYRQQASPENLHDLVLLGNGELKDSLQALVIEEGLNDAVHFPGFVSYQEICQWYATASVFVHPALSEQWGLVVNEAMAAELPTLVSSACGCVPDLVVHDVTGMVFDPRNQQQLVEQLLQLGDSPERRSQFGVAGRRHISDHFSPDTFGTSVLQAIDYISNSSR